MNEVCFVKSSDNKNQRFFGTVDNHLFVHVPLGKRSGECIPGQALYRWQAEACFATIEDADAIWLDIQHLPLTGCTAAPELYHLQPVVNCTPSSFHFCNNNIDKKFYQSGERFARLRNLPGQSDGLTDHNIYLHF
jgi:hypothetical protein